MKSRSSNQKQKATIKWVVDRAFLLFSVCECDCFFVVSSWFEKTCGVAFV
jgi:hypothetical protein